MQMDDIKWDQTKVKEGFFKNVKKLANLNQF